MFEPETAQVQRVIGKPGYFELTEKLEYYCRDGWIITVPKSFQTNFASIPAPLRMFFRVNGAHQDASIVHDYMYANRGHVALRRFTREQSDQIFFEAMLDSGVPVWKARLFWAGVRVGGWMFWPNKGKK